MSQTAFAVDEKPAALPFSAVVETLAACDVPFQRKGQEIALKDPRRVLTALRYLLTDPNQTGEIVGAVREHKAALLALADLRSGFLRLCERIITLRCTDPPKGTRAQALAWLGREIEKLADGCWESGRGLGRLNDAGEIMEIMGFDDPGDPFGGAQIQYLRCELTELTREDAPYPVPLPEGCWLLPQANFDPFEHGRLYNGGIIENSQG